MKSGVSRPIKKWLVDPTAVRTIEHEMATYFIPNSHNCDCGGASVSTSSDSGSSETSNTEQAVNAEVTATPTGAAELKEFFEANPWDLVGRTGFDTEQLETLVTFEVMGPDDTITITLVACENSATHAISWNDEGFALTDSLNAEGGYASEDQDCFDDVQSILFRTFAGDDDQFDVDIADNGETAVLSRGDRTLTLAPVGTELPPEAFEEPIGSTTEEAVESERPRRPVTFSYFDRPGDQLEIALVADVCDPEAPEFDVVEDAESATITITDITPDLGPNDEGEFAMELECQSTLRTPIDEPVNGRRIIDGTTGEEARVAGT